MSPKEGKAQKALEALIAAGLRVPDDEDITEQDIKRFVEENVTLSAEDEAALANSESGLFKSIAEILSGSPQLVENCSEKICCSNNGHRVFAMNRKNAANSFAEITKDGLERKRKQLLERAKKKKKI